MQTTSKRKTFLRSSFLDVKKNFLESPKSNCPASSIVWNEAIKVAKCSFHILHLTLEDCLCVQGRLDFYCCTIVEQRIANFFNS